MHRSGNRAISAMRIRNEYASQYGIQYYLIVEGENDEHFFENILDCGRCKVTNLNGKENVLEFIEEQNRCKRKDTWQLSMQILSIYWEERLQKKCITNRCP